MGAAHALLYGANKAGPGRRLAHALARDSRGALRLHAGRARPAARELLQPRAERASGSPPRRTCAGRGRSRWLTATRGARAPRRARRARGGDRPARLPAVRGARGVRRRRCRSTTPTPGSGCASRPRSSTGCGPPPRLHRRLVRGDARAGPRPGSERALARERPGRGQLPAARRHELHPLLLGDLDVRPAASACPRNGPAVRRLAARRRAVVRAEHGLRASTTPASCCGRSRWPKTPPTPLYAELHAVADEALSRVEALLAPVRKVTPAEAMVEAASVIEEAEASPRSTTWSTGWAAATCLPCSGSRSRTLDDGCPPARSPRA